ncbi:MAG: preprotein translocase subunit SecE [Deltaproteobacteria bacterium]|nr:preprotein translocase subunit SecE [Deltaproteobacteria bacterium]MCL5892717.1 preprotein translocase subunit SecE [Deltaproteobacteria bacterium]
MRENTILGYVKMVSNPVSEFIKKAKQYLYEVRSELGKIIWPDKDKATKTTYVVVIFIVLVTAFLGLIDMVFAKVFSYFFHI